MAGLLRISEAFALAFQASMYLVSRKLERPISAGDLADTFGVSEAHLAKVLQRLARAGVLTSKRGPGGGFTLTCDPGEVTLLDIHRAVDGELEPTTCLLATPICPEGTCVMKHLLETVYDEVHGHFDRTTLSDLAPPETKPSRRKGGRKRASTKRRKRQ